MDDDRVPRLPDRLDERIDVERGEAAHVHNLGGHPRRRELVGRLAGFFHHPAPRHQGDVGTRAFDPGRPERAGLHLVRHVLLDRPIEPDRFEEDHRVGVLDRRAQHTRRVGGSRRGDDLEPRGVRVDRLHRLGVVLGRADAASVWNPDDEGGGEAVPRAMPDARDVADDLVEGGVGEAHELQLQHRPEAGYGEAEPDADDAGLRERRVDDSLRTEALPQAVGDAEDAAGAADVLAEDQDVVVRRERLVECLVQRLCERPDRHRPASAWVRCAVRDGGRTANMPSKISPAV